MNGNGPGEARVQTYLLGFSHRYQEGGEKRNATGGKGQERKAGRNPDPNRPNRPIDNVVGEYQRTKPKKKRDINPPW